MKGTYTGKSPVVCPQGTRDTLAKVLGDVGYNRGAEIGVFLGDYSVTLCEANPNIELYCVDLWNHPSPLASRSRKRRHQKYFDTAKSRLSKYNATLIRKKSMDALADFEDEILDFVYIDANHAFDCVCMDIIGWSRKVRSGGIVAGHDYSRRHKGVRLAVHAYTEAHIISPWYLTGEQIHSWFWEKP